MLATLEGLDHVVIMVRDLDAAAQQWRDLGFTVSPRGTHSPHLGTGNYTIVFGDDYIELLGILTETVINAPSRDFLTRRGDGLERAAFRTTDAQAGADALAALSIQPFGPVHFSRPVTLPDGGSAEAAFSIFNWPADESPADLRLFACQHHTRDSVWIPSLMDHVNTVTGIRRVEVIAADPSAAAQHFARLIDGAARSVPEGMLVETGHGQADIQFMTKAAFTEAHGVEDDAAAPAEGAAALVFRVRDLAAARRGAGSRGVADGRALRVPAACANGVMLVFEPA